jgi:hypothetical protein
LHSTKTTGTMFRTPPSPEAWNLLVNTNKEGRRGDEQFLW